MKYSLSTVLVVAATALLGRVSTTHAQTITTACDASELEWVVESRLDAAMENLEQSNFGASVALRGTDLIVGDPAAAAGGGQAYGYQLLEQEWNVFSTNGRHVMEAGNPEMASLYGVALARAGDVVVVGAPDATVAGQTQAGAVYVYQQLRQRYRLVQKLQAEQPAAGARYGWSVDTDGAHVIVGTFVAAGPGQATIYGWDQTSASWVVETVLDGENVDPTDLFGIGVSIDAGTAAVGAAIGASFRGLVQVWTRRNNGTWRQQAMLEADIVFFGGFGVAVDVDANTIVVGAFDDNNGQAEGGSAFIFARQNGVWTQQARLAPPEPSLSIDFGASVQVSGDTVVVADGLYGTNGLASAGAVFVYTRDGNSWTGPVMITSPTIGEWGGFGMAISLDGDRLAIGESGTRSAYVMVQACSGGNVANDEPAEDAETPTLAPTVVEVAPTTSTTAPVAPGATLAPVASPVEATTPPTSAPVVGQTTPPNDATEPVPAPTETPGSATTTASLCEDATSAWVFEGLIRSTEESVLNFGTSVVLNEDVVIVADSLATAASGVQEAGAAFGYTLDELVGGWSPYSTRGRHAMDASDPSPGSNFGISVAKAGDLVVVGAPYAQVAGLQQAGAIYVFRQLRQRYRQEAKLVADVPVAFGRFGWSVDTDGVHVIAGSLFEESAGEVYIFGPSPDDATQWETQAAFAGEEVEPADLFGCDVSIDGGTAVIGQAVSSSFYGAAYVLQRADDGTWQMDGFLDSPEVALYGGFGASVAIHGDTIVVGAVDDDTDQPQGGSAFVFVRQDGEWTQQARLVPSEQGLSGEFGSYVAIYGDTAVVSDWQYDTGGLQDAGAAFVFERDGSSWSGPVLVTSTQPTELETFGVSVSVEGDRIVVGASGSNSAATYIRCPVVATSQPVASDPTLAPAPAPIVSQPSLPAEPSAPEAETTLPPSLSPSLSSFSSPDDENTPPSPTTASAARGLEWAVVGMALTMSSAFVVGWL